MKLRLLFVLVGFVMISAACNSGVSTETEAPPLEVSLLATDIAYDQTLVETVVGQPIRVTLSNEGALVHDFSIADIPTSGTVQVDDPNSGTEEMAAHDHGMEGMTEAPAVHVAAPPDGGSASVLFTPSTPGEYEYFCTVAGHKEAGMVGTLVVTTQPE